MKEAIRFRAYGENAATFLIFQALANCPHALDQVFVKNLKRFGTGRAFKRCMPGPSIDSATEVWLFPSFGKRYGFGEPDAVILIGEYVFWVEVETGLNHRTGQAQFRSSLLQLQRFWNLQRAIVEGARNSKGSRRFVGTIQGDSERTRVAQLKLAGHGVLKKIWRRLQAAGRGNNDHYVLFTIDKPRGKGSGESSYARMLSREVASVGKLPAERCWYAYWKGDIERKAQVGGVMLKLDEEYVRIKRKQ